MSGRIPHLDTLRAASILYIVGFWHLFNYTKAFGAYHNPATVRITVTLLGLFVFLSGYLMGLGRETLTQHGLAHFYRRRLLRIYPLYLVAIALWLPLNITQPATLFKAALVITPFHGPQPPTLWFITTLLVYYLLAPLLLKNTGNGLKFTLAAINLFLILWLAINLTHKGDIKLLEYFPVFATGIYAASLPSGSLRRHKVLILTGFLFAIAITLYAPASPENTLWSIPMTCLGALTLLLAAEALPIAGTLARCLAPVSYASYAMFLFHRPIYLLMSRLWPPEKNPLQIVYLLFLCLPLVIALSWSAQKLYDLALGKIRFATTREVR